MTRVFISYSRRDVDFARRLAQSLAQARIDVWMDMEDIEVGSKWSKAIQQGLDSSDVLCVVISPASMESSNVEDEWTYFLDQKKPVIPIHWKPGKIHFQLGRIQYIDFYTNPYDTALPLLLAEIEKRQKESAPLPPPPSPTLKTERITVEQTPSTVTVDEGALAKGFTIDRRLLLAGLVIGALILIGLVILLPGGGRANLTQNGAVSIERPNGWESRPEDRNDVWITNSAWFYDNGALNTQVQPGRISMRTVGAPVEPPFDHEDLEDVSLGVINEVFAGAGINRRFDDDDLQVGTINGAPAVWVRGQLEGSDYYMAFYYLEDQNWLQGVVVNAGRGDLDRNQQLVDELVNSIQVSV
jgi:hypothetical protein